MGRQSVPLRRECSTFHRDIHLTTAPLRAILRMLQVYSTFVYPSAQIDTWVDLRPEVSDAPFSRPPEGFAGRQELALVAQETP
jgi:hypothetical protein